ncbi:MAG TPA: hypothetical protein VF150_11180, partial [Thermoanaerobaculia bacterium]
VGFRTDLGVTSLPETTRDFLTAVPLVLLAWPAMMLALRRATARDEGDEALPAPAQPETGAAADLAPRGLLPGGGVQ